MKITIECKVDEAEWHNLLYESRQATIFHTFEWGKVLEEAYPFKYERLFILCRDNNGLLFGGMPLMSVKGVVHSLESMPLSTYGGAIVRDKGININLVKHSILEVFEGMSKNYSRTVLVDYDNYGLKFGKSAEYFAHIIELKPIVDEMFKSINKKRRNMVKQAIKKGVRCEELTNFEQFPYEIFFKTYRRHNLNPYPLALYEKILEIMVKKYLARCTVAIIKVEGKDKIIACNIYFMYNSSLMYWIGASDEDYFEYRPNDFLIWNAMEYGIKNGMKMFNLGASPLNNKDLVRFKELWGGIVYKYNIYEKTSCAVSVAKKMRNVVRKLK